MSSFVCRGRKLDIGPAPLIMGILNVTPDSFSDGGVNYSHGKAVNRALEMVREGADIVDIGGESTRPGYTPVSVDEELSRLIPVIKAISEISDTVISVDTYKADVARECLEAGAHIINDIYGLAYDPNMAGTAASYDAGVILMFNCRRNGPTKGEDICDRAFRELSGSIRAASDAGIPDDHIMTDPGVGFGTARDEDLMLMRELQRFSFGMRYPVLIGCSRKRIASVLLPYETEPDMRDHVSAGLALAAYTRGASVIRVHNVRETYEAFRGFNEVYEGGK